MSFQYLFHSPPVAASQASDISFILIFLPELPFFQAESWCLYFYFFPLMFISFAKERLRQYCTLHVQSENTFIRVAHWANRRTCLNQSWSSALPFNFITVSMKETEVTNLNCWLHLVSKIKRKKKRDIWVFWYCWNYSHVSISSVK